MARPKIFTNEEMMDLLAKIEIDYGFLSTYTIDQAHKDKPYEIPSEKTFRRRLGNHRGFNSPTFRDRLKPHLDKLKKK